MKKSLALLAAILLAACGDTIENQMGMEVVTSVGDLPKCTRSNEGEQAYVKGEPSPRICVDGEWFATKSADGSDFACKTEELKDKSGLKIVCNGDSIGVVLNGSDGKDGKAGKDGEDGQAGTGCSMKEKTDSTITVVCGDSTMVIELGTGSETPELDSERVAVSLDSLAGYSQKGPFLKGSTVYLYELSDGRTLKQTNGNFTSFITRDDGRYKFTARDLASQYAMIVVEGNYRNEVTGKPSNATIRLRALTDMRKKSDANINLLTHLEFDRVYYLVTREGMTVKKAKKQAQAEIMKQFHIDTTAISGSAEDLNVFGESDADAALLAISVLLQGDGNETDLSVLLTEISNDMESDGVWDDSTTRARIADWALEADTARISRLDTFRVNVKSWGLSDTVPGFEKFLRSFVAKENNFGVCGSSGVPIGTVKHVSNSKSAYYAKKYDSIGKDDSKIRFICKDLNGARWIPATDIEKDTVGFGHDDIEGAIRRGKIDTNLTYVYEDGYWRHGTDLDDIVGLGCALSRKDTVALGKNGVWYKCKKDTSVFYSSADGSNESEWTTAWREATALEMDTYESLKECKADGLYGDGTLLNGRINKTELYACDNGEFRNATSQEIEMGKGCVSYIKGKNYPFGKMNYYYTCAGEEGWTLDRDNWVTDPRDGTTYRTVTIGNQVIMAENLSYEYKVLNPSSGDSVVYGNACYSEDRMWQSAEVLDSCRTLGRYYTWGAAIDSAAVFSDDGKGCTASFYFGCNMTTPVRGICPEGWHLPDSTEWQQLYNFVEGNAYALEATGFKEWAFATDEYGLSLRPAGWYRLSLFDNSNIAFLWTASLSYSDDKQIYVEYSPYYVYVYSTSYLLRVSDRGSRNSGNPASFYLLSTQSLALSVRCFKN